MSTAPSAGAFPPRCLPPAVGGDGQLLCRGPAAGTGPGLAGGNAENSALAVGTLSILGALPLLFMPLGGVISDQVDRRRLILVGRSRGPC